ncbi:hypothetical protein [Nocardia asiatica]|uniref:hypothetical protein n=1 Tax=Nocardia asiatica TaxID=209252 RepID=UPI0002DB6967|nr:hypothetical protein [Nocardia asiatica]
MSTHTIALADEQDSTGAPRAITPVYYGMSRGRCGMPGHMLISYNAEHGTAFLYGQPYGHSSGAIACRILHGDILAIGEHRFRVHCPEDWRQWEPALRRIDNLYTREQVAAAGQLVSANAHLKDVLDHEPYTYGAAYDRWHDECDQAYTAHVTAQFLYRDLFAGQVPSAFDVLAAAAPVEAAS